MTTNPLLEGKSRKGEKSPSDPHECCVWANDRMSGELAQLGYKWAVTGNKDRPIALLPPA